MRKTTTLQKVQYPAPDVITKVIPAPTEGWDAISPLADMSPQRAVILENWVPRPGYIENRKGYVTWVESGLNSPVQALMVYETPSTVKMYAAYANGTILDVTASSNAIPYVAENGTDNYVDASGNDYVSGEGFSRVVATIFSTGRWQWTNYTPAQAPTVLQFVNGTDSLQQISGTVISSVSITGMSILSSTAVTNDFINIAAIHRRLWYVRKNSTQAVFLGTDAIQGPIAGYLDVGALWSKGGFLVAIADWTVDGGVGPNDYTVFISSRGQISVYSGFDPTSTSFALIGTFDVAPPIGRRCFYKLGSDLLIITQQGILPISQVLPFDPSADRSTAVTLRIQNAMLQAATTYGANFGWEVISYPQESLLIMNVPIDQVTTTGGQWQFVQNVLTGAWCKFTGWPANTFAIFNNSLYFGDKSGNVNWAYQTGSDGGNAISANFHAAFNWYDNPGRLKRITYVQPLLAIQGGTPVLGIVAAADFHVRNEPIPSQTFSPSGVWDTAIWDVDMWGGQTVVTPWISVNAIGKAISFYVSWTYNTPTIVTDGIPNTQINAFNTIAELGGMI